MNMLPLFEETRPIQYFADKPVPQSLILSILEEAVWAPNHKFREPWRMILAKGERKQKLALTLDPDKHGQLQQTIAAAPVCLVITAKKNEDKYISDDDFAAVCCLIQNIQLLGWANQLGMIWQLADYTDCVDFLSILGIQSDERIVGVLCLGYFDQLPEKTAALGAHQITTW
ncbi:nitroreductase [Bacillus sp. FJAT-50079]|uniref:nitroreductase family protein n=1 Tax=Bacillus sp. FJAT-50079 TaxID=2833577 RepID=UPI001BCA66AC|nr:nitroreductase [Bacillus sp. FJAT-50079]MBS4209325.1 nitroreductase [Bacillus sp. FJAT-50079]